MRQWIIILKYVKKLGNSRNGGDTFIERHMTLVRAMWGSDQAASVEVMGMYQLVRNVRDIERAMGDGIKRVYESEQSSLQKLRKVTAVPAMAEAVMGD